MSMNAVIIRTTIRPSGPRLIRGRPSFRRPAEGRFPELSAREQEVLEQLAAGRSNQQIADELVISPITVRNHVSSILAKLQVSNRREAMLRYHDR